MLENKILVADDEQSMREFLDIMLKKEGYRVTLAGNGEEVLKLIEKDIFDLVLLDIRMPKMDGIAVLKKIKAAFPETIVIMITAYASTDTAIKAMKEGAYDYITKPFKSIEEIKVIIKNALEKKNLQTENLLLKQVVKDRYQFGNIIGQSPKMQALYELLERLAPTKTNILITGESGTGKELVAKAIHYNSSRKDKAFVTLNCGAIPESLIESELFGHMKGAFTDAIATKKGLFEMADEGTIFLDEISELPLLMQVKLLRVLQDKEFKRVGGTEDIRVDVRIISATNKDLEAAVREKRFREDLFYRLNVIQIKLPPLRERREDIPVLAAHFLKKYSQELNKNINKISPEALHLLLNYGYPGNVRELQNIIERAVALGNGQELVPQHLNSYLEEQIHANKGVLDLDIPSDGIDLEKIIEDIERALLLKALDRTKGIKKKAAELLHINFRSMRYRLEKYGLDNGGDEEVS
jgi:two-component system response regulator PilR (NtrC family)